MGIAIIGIRKNGDQIELFGGNDQWKLTVTLLLHLPAGIFKQDKFRWLCGLGHQ